MEINNQSNNNKNDNVFDENNFDSHRGENTRSKDNGTTAIVLVKVSDNNKDFPIEMNKERYDSLAAGNENENKRMRYNNNYTAKNNICL